MASLTRRLFVAAGCAIALAACARSVNVVSPPEGAPVQSNPVTFTVEFHPRANVSTFSAIIEPPLTSGPQSGPLDITSNFSPPPAPGGQSTATVTVPQSECSLLRVGCQDERYLRVRADMSPGQAFDSHGHDRIFLLPGVAGPPPPPPPPPSPSVTLNVTPTTASAVWGQSASYTVEVGGRNGFSGPVNLVVDQLPAGVTPTLSTSSVTLAANGPPQTSALSLATTFGATPPGSSSFRVQATSSASTVRRNATLAVARIDGPFAKSTHLSASSTCGADVSATYQSIALNDIRVTFEVSNRPSGTQSTQAIPSVYYAFSQAPDCRIGVVMHPCQQAGCTGAGDPALSWYNLGWQASTPAIPQRVENETQINWHQFWFNADQSLLLLITKMAQAVTCVPSCPHLDMRAFVYDSLTGTRLGQVDFRTQATGSIADPTANVTGASLSGNVVTIDFVRETGNADSRTITLP
jgi:hypothetical protein